MDELLLADQVEGVDLRQDGSEVGVTRLDLWLVVVAKFNFIVQSSRKSGLLFDKSHFGLGLVTSLTVKLHLGQRLTVVVVQLAQL